MSEITNTVQGQSYRSEVHFTAAPDVVFEALTTLPGLTGWWTPAASGSGAAGGELRLVFPNTEGRRVVLSVDTADPAGTVVWRVADAPSVPDWAEWPGTRVVFRLHPDAEGGTTLEFLHEGLNPRLDCYDTCSRGWDHALASLRSYADTGAGHPFV